MVSIDESGRLVTVLGVSQEIQDSPEQSLDHARTTKKEVEEHYAAHPGERYALLFDIRTIDVRMDILKQAAMAYYEQLIAHPQTSRAAILGKSGLHNTLLKFLVNKRDPKIRWFSDEFEAKTWLSANKS